METMLGHIFLYAVNNYLYYTKMQMAKHNIGSLVVLKPGDQQCIAGIVTERGKSSLLFFSFHGKDQKIEL